MLLNWADDIADFIERFRRYGSWQWALRGIVLGCGVVALVPLWIMQPSIVFGVLALLVLVIAAMFPRGHVVTAFLVVVVIWTAVAGATAGEAGAWGAPWVHGIIALGAVGAHWAAGACALGPSFAEIDGAVWKRHARPLFHAAAAIVAAVIIASLLSLVSLPGSAILVILSLVGLLAGGAIVLWPRVATPRR